MKRSRLALVALLIATMSAATPLCFAKDKDADATAGLAKTEASTKSAADSSTASGSTSSVTGSGSSTSSSSASASSSSTLKGGIMSVAATAEKEVKEIGTTCHHLAGSIANVFGEVNRQDQVLMSEPDVVGTMVIPAIPDASGMMSMGTLPPRKKWLDYFNYQTAQLIDILYKEAHAVVLPDDASAQTNTDWTRIKELIDQMVPVYKKMQSLSEGPKFDNVAIATQAQMLHDTVKQIDKLRKSVFNELKREDKTRKKDSK